MTYNIKTGKKNTKDMDYNNGDVFSRELLEPGRTFSGFWGTENPGR